MARERKRGRWTEEEREADSESSSEDSSSSEESLSSGSVAIRALFNRGGGGNGWFEK